MKRRSLEAKIVMQKGQRVALVNLSGSIGLRFGFHGNQLIESLTNLGEYDVLYVTMDSPGRSTVEAWTIFHFLRETRQTRSDSLVLITDECSGGAVLIALGFDQILITRTKDSLPKNAWHVLYATRLCEFTLGRSFGLVL